MLETHFSGKLDYNKLDDIGYAPIFYAAWTNNKTLAETLLKNGANIHGTGYHDKTALHIAAANGNSVMAEFLLDNGAKLEAEDSFGNTPLHDACAAGDMRVCELFLSRGSMINKKNRNNVTPLMVAVVKDQVCTLIDILRLILFYHIIT